jgi:hypothetical protein
MLVSRFHRQRKVGVKWLETAFLGLASLRTSSARKGSWSFGELRQSVGLSRSYVLCARQVGSFARFGHDSVSLALSGDSALLMTIKLEREGVFPREAS